MAASAKCGAKCARKWILVLMVVLPSMSGNSQASPFDPSFFPEGVQSVVVNPFNRTILNHFNLTEEQILSIQNRSNSNMRNDTSMVTNQQHLQRATERLNDIIKRVHKAISNEALPKEKAGFPICNAETTSPADWQNGNNLTLQFASSVFIPTNEYDRLNSALLRLYKKNPGQYSGQGPVVPVSTEQPASPTPQCAETVGPQIRVTVSIVHQQRKKLRKKRTCNTVMMSSTSTGWVEIDVKCALAYWEQQHRQEENRQEQLRQPHPRQQQTAVVGMLVIEVHDDEENPLRPGLYFEPPTCDQAAAAVPWNTYGTESLSAYLEGRSVPRKPRLDLKFNGSSSLKRLCNSPKLPSSRATFTVTESTTSNSPIDNQLLEETESQPLPNHHRRHHSSEVEVHAEIEAEGAASAAEAETEELISSASNSEQEMEPISNHHRRRTGHHHRHHHHPHELQQHHHHQRHHHKHHIIPHQQE